MNIEDKYFFAIELYNEALSLIKLNAIPRAYDKLKQSLGYDPELARSWGALGEVELKLWKYYDAVESFKNALKYARPYEFPKKGVLYSLGTAYIKIKKYEEAIETYEEILAEDPKHADSLVNMAFAYEMLKNYQKEIECCKKVLELNSKDVDALYNIAGTCMYLQNYSEAVTWLEKLVKIKPDDYMAWNNLSVSYNKLGNTDKAEYCKKSYSI